MFETFSYRGIAARATLFDGMLLDRTRQFVTRHCWDLWTDQHGREIDNFDHDGTTYCVVHKDGSHLASLRLRPASDDCMTAGLCADAWRENQRALAEGLEVTRLCASPCQNAVQGSLATVELLRGLCRFGLRNGTPVLYGLVFPGVARSIRVAGWPSQTLARFTLDERTVFLARWECSHEVDWSLQERLERLEETVASQPLSEAA